jgi:5-dehydro-2-deoxygluconokinase
VARGYTRPLYVLPFDHRASFSSGMFGFKGALSADQVAQIAAAKRVIYDGFVAAVAGGVARDKGGILVDEQFGEAILRDAKVAGDTTCMPLEKSGQDEFDWEYGADWGAHVDRVRPTFAKVLVRYNPEGDAAINRAQAERLRQTSERLAKGSSLFMFELLVPATSAQLASLGNDKHRYDLERRPALTMAAIRELQGAGVEPDVWKVEGLDRREDCAAVADTARREGRGSVGCIILGRGENEAHVRAWLATAAAVPGFIGFAVGRTTFWQPLVDWRAQKISRDAAVALVARRYREWIDVFEHARGA